MRGRAFNLCQDGFEKRSHLRQLLDSDDEVPGAFELLPSRAVKEVLQSMLGRAVRRGCLENGIPPIKRFVGPIVTVLQFIRRHALWTIDNMARVVKIPISSRHPILRGHVGEKRGAGVWRQNVKCRRGDPRLDRPVDGARENISIFTVQTIDEAPVDHDAEVVEPADHLAIVAPQVLAFPRAFESAAGKRLEADEETAQPRRRRQSIKSSRKIESTVAAA